MKQGIPKIKGGDEHMVARPHKVQQGIDLGGTRFGTKPYEDKGLFPFFLRQGRYLLPVDRYLCIGEEERKAFIGNISPIRDLILAQERDPTARFITRSLVTGRQGNKNNKQPSTPGDTQAF